MKTNIFKKIFCLFLVLILSVNFVNVWATNSKGTALNNFTERQKELIFGSNLSNIVSEYGDIFDLVQKTEIFNDRAEKIESTRKVLEESNENILSRITNLEETKKMLEEDIAKILVRIQDLSIASVQLKLEIETTEKKIEVTKNQVDENKKVLLSYIDYMYKKSNSSYNGYEVDNLKSIILNDEDISTLINDLYFSGLLQVAGDRLIKKHFKFISELYIEKVNLENKQSEYSNLRKEMIIEQKNLKDKRDFQERLIEISKNKQQEYEKLIAEKLRNETKLREIAKEQEKKVQELRDKILSENNCEFIDFSKISEDEKENLKKQNQKCFNLNHTIYLESQLNKDSASSEKNPMTWPVLPTRGLSAFYREEAYKKTLGADHNAIDIRANQGSELKSAMAGYVIYINPPTTPDYSFLAIKHPNGYTSVYGHLSEINVKLYEYVEKGQIIGKTGGEVGTNGAGYLSTGPHLHFEVFKNQEYIDPLDVLDLSYLKYTSIPTKYQFKYQQDFEARRGYKLTRQEAGSNIFILEGKDEIERQQYLINKYASSAFRNYEIWKEQALIGNIDPSVVMCIGLAESGLGRNLTTGYNVGNVGNTDSGARRAYSSAQDGIGAIVRTLNNKYFQNVNRIDMLSGAGRIASNLPGCRDAGQSCYATDTKYWHPNVISCLSHLKGRIIEDDYNFRITK